MRERVPVMSQLVMHTNFVPVKSAITIHRKEKNLVGDGISILNHHPKSIYLQHATI